MFNYAVQKSGSSNYNPHLTTTTTTTQTTKTQTTTTTTTTTTTILIITTLTNILPDLYTACKLYDYCAAQNGL
jgi:hypothetical protein